MVDNPKNSVFTKDPEVIPFMTCANTPLVVPKTSSGSKNVIDFTKEEALIGLKHSWHYLVLKGIKSN